MPKSPLAPLFQSIGIYTTFSHNKNNELQKCQAPSSAGEGWGEENKIKQLYFPSSQPSPSRESIARVQELVLV